MWHFRGYVMQKIITIGTLLLVKGYSCYPTGDGVKIGNPKANILQQFTVSINMFLILFPPSSKKVMFCFSIIKSFFENSR